jgi:hypothetical protein
MVAGRIGLIGLGVIILTATAALAQNTSNSALSGNTANPVLSGNSTLLPARQQLSHRRFPLGSFQTQQGQIRLQVRPSDAD